jgi:hypothetical protein
MMARMTPLRTSLNTPLPTWPKERDLCRYQEFTKIDFIKDLSPGQTWIDIGCRTGKALSEFPPHYNLNLVGINAHKIQVRPGIQSLIASIPKDTSVLKKYKKKAHLVTDVHGAVSYCENPLEALIYEACLLAPRSKAAIITLEDRMGSPNVTIWKQIQHFFQSIMGQEITFKRFTSYTDNTKSPIKTLRITITGECCSSLNLHDLFLAARHSIGQMKKKKVIAESIDKSAQVWRVLYKKEK